MSEVGPHLGHNGIWGIMCCNLKKHDDLGLSLTSIFFDSIIDILFFDSDYFDLILKNCTNRIFSHVQQYICG